MLQVVRKNAMWGLLSIVVISGVAFLITLQITLAQETNPNNNIRELLETLKARTEAGESFEIGFRFAHPLMENDELYWGIPYSPPNEDISRWIGEIGDDFICFYEQAGSAGGARCTPFSNIVSISYLGSP